MQDRLSEMFFQQDELQKVAYGKSPSDIVNDEERIQFLKDMNMALQDELHEFLGEIGWKPWATSRHVNTEAAQAELVDAFHFFMNLCLGVGMTPDDLYAGYLRKREKNIKRQEDGYDGVSTKCGVCNRALDDDAVMCREDPAHSGYYICYAGVAIRGAL